MRHLLRPMPDTQDAIAERIRSQAIQSQAQREMTARYPSIRANNAEEALNWKLRRIRQLQKL